MSAEVQADTDDETEVEEVIETGAEGALVETETEGTLVGTETAYETEEMTTTEDGTAEDDTEVEEIEFDNADASGDCGASGSNVKWSYNSETQTLTISGNGYMKDYGDEPDGDGWGWIDTTEFSWQNLNVDKVIVEEGVKSIGVAAFYHMDVLQVTLPNSLEEIKFAAFQGCLKLPEIKIPEGVKSIGNGAFEMDSQKYCALKSVELPNSVTSIGSRAFKYCDSLEKVKIPNGITKINDETFSGCLSLTSVELPDSVEIMGTYVFQDCRKLSNIKLPNKIIKIPTGTFYECTKLTNVELPDGLMDIGSSAFYKCKGLKNIKIPEKVSSIDNSAFSECSADLTLLVYKDSAAHKYATRKELNYQIIATGISLDSNNIEITEGETKTLTAKLQPEGASYPDVEWKSSNSSIASIENGSVTGKQKGTCTITATCGEYTATCKVTITERKNVLDVYANPPSSTKVTAGTKIELKCDTAGAKIYYTENGSDPTANGRLYNDTEKITVNTDITIKAYATKEGCTPSNVTELKFYVTTSEPDPKPNQVSKVYANYTSGANLAAGTKISLYCDTAGATIYYTLDNKEPTIGSTRYTEAITISKDTVIKAIAVKSGYENSEIAELKFYVTATEPDPKPNQVSKVYASYTSGQTLPLGTRISLYCDTEDATIYYTLDNTEPTTGSAHYTGEITISKDTVIKAFAVKAGYENSELSVFWFYVNDETVEEDEVLPEDIPGTGVPNGMWVAAIKDQCYTGAAIKPAVHVYEGRKRLEEKKDYTLSYKKNINKGTAEIVITGKGNYKDTQSAFFNITIKDITAGDVIIDDMAFAYDGKPHKAVPVITYNGKKLKPDKDFKVEFGSGDYTQEGTYYATVKGIGNYIGTYTQAKTVILDKTRIISKASVIKPSSKEYNDGKEVTLSADELKVVLGGFLTRDKDYEVSYINNVNPGTATAVIRGKGAYAGTKQVTFKIVRKPIDIGLATVSYNNSMSFTKGRCMPEPKVTYKGETLKKGTDYTVSYSKNKKVGNAVFVIKGKGRFNKNKSFTFVINQKSIEDVTVRVPDAIYTGKANAYQSKPILTDSDGKALSAGSDYTIQSYSSYGTALDKKSNPPMNAVITVKLSGKGNYRGDISAAYTLRSGINISKAQISVHDQTYTGKAITLLGTSFKSASIKIEKDQVNLIYGRDYIIVPSSYVNNIKTGTATVVIRGIGQYAGDKTVKFKITGKKIFF